VIAFLLYVQQFFRPIQILSQFYTGTIGSVLERIFLLLDEPSQLKDATDAVEMPPIRGEVFLQSALATTPTSWFSGSHTPAKPGQMIALVLPVLAKALSST